MLASGPPPFSAKGIDVASGVPSEATAPNSATGGNPSDDVAEKLPRGAHCITDDDVAESGNRTVGATPDKLANEPSPPWHRGNGGIGSDVVASGELSGTAASPADDDAAEKLASCAQAPAYCGTGDDAAEAAQPGFSGNAADC